MEDKSSKTVVDGISTVKIPEIKEFLKAGVQFGHETVRWNPKMKQYIYGSKNKIHILDLQKTLPMLEDACKFLTGAAKRGPVLFIATKRQARDIVEKYSIESGSYFVTFRWWGGLLPNLKLIKKSLNRYMQIEEEFEKGVVNRTKFEVNQLKKEWERMNRIYRGVKTMDRFPSAVIVVDCHYEKGAVLEARAAGIPIISMVDTNSDPDLVDFVIPSNDDASKSLNLILGILSEAIKMGNGGHGVKHVFKDFSNYEVQIIKQNTPSINEIQKIKAVETTSDEPKTYVKPQSKAKKGVQKGILELVKEEAKKEEIKTAKKAQNSTKVVKTTKVSKPNKTAKAVKGKVSAKAKK